MVVLGSSVMMTTQRIHFQIPPPLNTLFSPATATATTITPARRIMMSKTQSRTRTRITPAAAVASDTTNSTSLSDKDQNSNKYYFVVANAKFMLDEEEHFKELMEERLRLFQERNLDLDFWLVVEPKFLDRFPNIAKRLKRPAVALVSTNRPWITYMKLRLDRVLSESYEADSVEEALASNPVKLEFEKPENWVAPYEKYDYGWWEAFLPRGSENIEA